MKWTSIFIEPRFDAVVVNDLFFECIRTRFWATNHFDHFRMLLPSAGLQRCYCLLCHDSAYLISLWRVYLRNTGLNFLISIRSGVFFRFFVVIYRDVPGMPEFLCSVHSRMTCTRLPFLAIFRELGCKYSESARGNKGRRQIQQTTVEKPPQRYVFRTPYRFSFNDC